MKRQTRLTLLLVIGLPLLGYVGAYLGTTTLEDRKATTGYYGGLLGARYARHFQTESHCLAFLPLLWAERWVRGGQLDPTIKSGKYNRVIPFL